jgi:katanin p80 WD40 repeat-containing subunit B1
LAISPDGQWVASGGVDGKLKIWEITTGRAVYELPQHNYGSKH